MEQGRVERRRGRRVALDAPLRIRALSPRETPSFQQKLAKNISLAGLYFETDEQEPYAQNQIVMAAVSIPEHRTRDFPFTRLSGRGRVVRIEPLPAQGAAARRRFGVALEFGDDLTALTAIPTPG